MRLHGVRLVRGEGRDVSSQCGRWRGTHSSRTSALPSFFATASTWRIPRARVSRPYTLNLGEEQMDPEQ